MKTDFCGELESRDATAGRLYILTVCGSMKKYCYAGSRQVPMRKGTNLGAVTLHIRRPSGQHGDHADHQKNGRVTTRPYKTYKKYQRWGGYLLCLRRFCERLSWDWSDGTATCSCSPPAPVPSHRTSSLRWLLHHPRWLERWQSPPQSLPPRLAMHLTLHAAHVSRAVDEHA